jgi:hypothetical protein
MKICLAEFKRAKKKQSTSSNELLKQGGQTPE